VGRLVQAADAVDDPVLDKEVLKAKILSYLVNLGGAYAALNPSQNGEIAFFLDTSWRTPSNFSALSLLTLKASNELEAFLKIYPGLQANENFKIAKNTLWTLSALPSEYIRGKFSSPLTTQKWIKDVLSYANIKSSLQPGERILDPSNLFDTIRNVADRTSAERTAGQLYAYITPEPTQVASTNLNLIAQESIGDAIGQGLWEFVIAVGGTLGYLILDASGRISRIVFKSSSESDSRTDAEKQTDEAISDMLRGSIPTDSRGNPLQEGQTRNPKEPVENYEKPEGDTNTQRDDIEKLANDTGSVVEVKQSSNGLVRIVELPSGQSAGAYPKASSTGGPTTQVTLRGNGRSLKVRYTKGSNRRATILIPTA
jgi:hypothetical protein